MKENVDVKGCADVEGMLELMVELIARWWTVETVESDDGYEGVTGYEGEYSGRWWPPELVMMSRDRK